MECENDCKDFHATVKEVNKLFKDLVRLHEHHEGRLLR